MIGYYINKVADNFVFDYKLYGVSNSFIDYFIKTYNNTTGNLGILFNGIKGTGKTVTAKMLCNKLQLPVILIKNCNKVEEMLRWKCNFYNVLKVINGKDKTLRESKYNRKIDKYIYRTVPGGAEFIKRVRKNLGIKTMKEVLHDKDSTFMFHFGDNDIYEINGMTELGQADENKYNTEKENEKIRNSKYESESYSAKRFFEILIRYFVERGKVDLSDPGLLDYWKINEKDNWYKKNHPGKKYYLDGTTATWKDIYNDMLKCNAIMHEG